MNKAIKKVVVLGGGTAGWISAALLKKVIGTPIDIELVESEDIGIVGVGEATIPPIRTLNEALGLNEAEFLRETQATMKLAIKFENWRVKDESYYHTFNAPGKSMAFCHFHHFWKRGQSLGLDASLWDYDLSYLCCEAGKFARINSKDPIVDLPYAYHFDASLYARYLRKISEAMGVVRTEGVVESVEQDPTDGFVKALILKTGQKIEGDLFIDCSGFRGLLIQQTLGTGYEDWSHLLPCDSAVAVPSERLAKTVPYTRSIAHKAGWQWRIPLQHRNGNGHVFSSSYISDDEATDILMNNLDTKPLDDPRIIRFTTGRRRKQWNRNVVSVGLASGFLEPLESTSIHLIQSAITRLIHLFPHQGIMRSEVDEFNRQSQIEFEHIRDFLVLHYHATERDDSQFWRDMRNLEIPDSLRHRMQLFKDSGKLFREQDDLFLESSWIQVLIGQGIEPKDYHPMANSLPEQKLKDMLNSIRAIKQEPVSKLPEHDEFIKRYCAVR